MEVITLDWRQFSTDAFNEFKEALKKFNLYFGDLIEDYYGDNDSDTYVLYINERKLEVKEIKEKLPMIGIMLE